MKIQNASLPPLNLENESARQQASSASSNSADDVHLSELVRSLRSLAADSPERQERIEQIARAYASGSYKVDADAVAAKIIDDGIGYR